MTLVLDASVTVAFCLGDDPTGYARSVLRALGSDDAVAPPIWPVEVTNAFCMSERRKRIQAAETSRMLELLKNLPVYVEGQTISQAFDDVLPLARKAMLSCYDACYLDLALRKSCPVATLDSGLKKACRRTGVELWRA